MSRLVTRLPRDTDDGAEHNTILSSGTIQSKFNTYCACYTCQNCYRTMQMWYKFQVIFLPDEAYWTSFVLKSRLENSETWTGTNIDKVCTLHCVVLSVQSIMHCQQRQQSDLPKIAPRRYLSLVNQCVLILLIVFFPIRPWIETKDQDLGS